MRWSVILPPGDSAKSPSSRPSPTSRRWNCGTRGYLRALAKAGLHADPRLYGEVAYAGYRQHVCDTLDRILATVPDTDGFFFTTHILATEALRYFHDRASTSATAVGACLHARRPAFPPAAPQGERRPPSPSKRSAPTPCASCCGKSAKANRPAPSARHPNRWCCPAAWSSGTNKPVPSGHPSPPRYERPAKR